MEYETPLDHLRPQSTSDKEIDQSAVLDYNEILKGMDPQDEHPQVQFQQQAPQMQQQPMQQAPQMQQQQMQQQPPMQQPQYRPQQYQIPNRQYQQPYAYPARQQQQKQVGSQLNDVDIDYVYVAVIVSLLFSEPMQTQAQKLMPGLFNNGQLSFVGTLMHAAAVALGLYLVRRVKFV